MYMWCIIIQCSSPALRQSLKACYTSQTTKEDSDSVIAQLREELMETHKELVLVKSEYKKEALQLKVE